MKKTSLKWSFVALAMAGGLASCSIDMPKETNTSYETLTVEKGDITVPVKFSAKLKGQADVAITPQVSGQLMQICVSEGQQVRKGQTLFVIDSRNARLELEAAEANLQAALASENSAKLEYESNRNLFDKNIVSRYMLDNSENSYKRVLGGCRLQRTEYGQIESICDFFAIFYATMFGYVEKKHYLFTLID